MSARLWKDRAKPLNTPQSPLTIIPRNIAQPVDFGGSWIAFYHAMHYRALHDITVPRVMVFVCLCVVYGKFPSFRMKQRWGLKGAIFRQEIENISETVRYTAKVAAECGHKLVHSLSIGDIFDDVTWPLSEFKVILSRRFERLSVIRFTYLVFRVVVFTLSVFLCALCATQTPVVVDLLYTVSQKRCHPNHSYNFVNSWWICQILSLQQRAVNFQQNLY